MKTAAILIRETAYLPTDAQRASMRAYAAMHGLPVGRIYVDDGRRPRLAQWAVKQDAGTGFDVLVVPHLGALGGTMGEILGLLSALEARDVRLMVADAEPSAVSGLLEAIPLLQAAQDALRHEAILRGRERARRRGVTFGRPRLCEEKAERARAALAAGAGVRGAARAAGISPASVIRLRISSTG